MFLLTRFAATRPPFQVSQADSLAWLAAVHARAEATREDLDDGARQQFEQRLARVIDRCACPPSKIASRGHSVADVGHTRWDDAELYDVSRDPHGRGSAARTRRFGELVDAYFRDAYSADTAPDDLIHVTCTGYLSPSGAQKLVAERRWPTRVTHAYQMGCYAAIPAVRLAAGLAALGARRIDVVHTELCSLHLDPSDHRIEQLVVHSLFADGLIRYTLGPDEGGPGLRLLALHEVIVPGSADAMSWVVGDHGMQMTLARDVPERIASALRPFVTELYRRADVDLGRLGATVFAVHPGGPKIIDRVRDVLELSDAQLAASRRVLRDHGNMSSATLPHIWQAILDDPAIPRGTPIASLAFGPGLSVCGAMFEKR